MNHNYERHKARYRDHLDSPYWQTVRDQVYEKQQGICEYCHKHLGKYYHVHHLTYLHLFHELDALHSVCAVHPACHEEIHTEGITWAELKKRFDKL